MDTKFHALHGGVKMNDSKYTKTIPNIVDVSLITEESMRLREELRKGKEHLDKINAKLLQISGAIQVLDDIVLKSRQEKEKR